MLEIELTRALEPEHMGEQPCGICGAEFQPAAVLAQLVTDSHLPPVCEPCLAHLARRAEDGDNAADWDKVYRRYVEAVAKYREPVFPSVEALMEFENSDPYWNKITPMMVVELEGDLTHIEPTVLYKGGPDALTAAVVEGPKGRALMVFRSEAEAEKYRAGTGNNPEAEGWRAVNLALEDLANVLAMHECTHVAMPEEWTGKGAVDFFAAGDFIAMLRGSVPA